MPRGGKRPGAGRRKHTPESTTAPRKYEAGEIIESLGVDNGHSKGCKCWKCLWKSDAERADAIGHHARKYLWDRHSGKPVDTVNHLHDKPIEMTLNVRMSELIREVRQRKQDYERNCK